MKLCGINISSIHASHSTRVQPSAAGYHQSEETAEEYMVALYNLIEISHPLKRAEIQRKESQKVERNADVAEENATLGRNAPQLNVPSSACQKAVSTVQEMILIWHPRHFVREQQISMDH